MLIPPLGHTIEHHEAIGSTNDRALELALEGAAEGLVVVADAQTAGRGRRGRRWQDIPGRSLLYSVVLRPTFEAEVWPLIGLAAGVAAARAITQLTELSVWLKWPNDLVVAWQEAPEGSLPARKLGGVLLEAREGVAVVGTGINILATPPLEPAEGALVAACIADYCAEPPLPRTLLAAILEFLQPLYEGLQRGWREDVLAGYRALDIVAGMAVTLSVAGREFSGVATGIDRNGALLLRTPTGTRAFAAGELRGR